MNALAITHIIDKYLQAWIAVGMNKTPATVATEMADTKGPDNEGWSTWYPIASTATDEDIEHIEKEIGHTLPGSYKVYLKYKHFYELYIASASFTGQVIYRWKKHLSDRVFNGYPKEFLIYKGYIPFADWEDWGVLCFDTNTRLDGYEYPVILWDHDRWDEYEPFSNDFERLLIKLDRISEADAMIDSLKD